MSAVLRPGRKPYLPSSLFLRLMRSAFPGWGKSAEQEPATVRRQGFALEAIEPRLLLSADISYPANIADVGITGTTLKAEDHGAGGLFLKLYETSNLSNEVASVQLDDAGDVNVNITRAVTPDLVGDTMCVDLSTFSVLDSFVSSNGGKLNINFAGGNETPLTDDHVVVQGNGVLGYGLGVNSSCDITLDAGASLSADDITLASNAASTGLPPDLLTPNKFYADSNAGISILGSLTSTSGDIKLTSTSTIDVDNNSLSLGPLQLAFIYANSDASVNIGGTSNITSAGKLDITATSNVSGTADMASLNSHTDASTDAAVASVIITSNATASVSGSASLNVTGALALSAKNISIAGAIADGSKGGAGATLGLAVITGTTEASIKDNATVQADSIAVNAESQNDLTALAKSTTGGATTSGTQQDSQTALADNNAQSSGGSISLAGAVAVGTVPARRRRSSALAKRSPRAMRWISPPRPLPVHKRWLMAARRSRTLVQMAAMATSALRSVLASAS